MATFTSKTYDGRYMQLTITESVNVVANTSTLTWTLKSLGGAVNYYSTGPTTVTINGEQVYYKGRTGWSTESFPAAKGTVSGTITVSHNSNGAKSVAVGFSTAIYTSAVTEHGGTMTLTTIDRNAPTVSLSTSSVTASSVIITATSSATADDFDYSLDNGATWKGLSTTAGTTATKTITGLSPNTSYTIKVRARRQYNQIWGTSSAKTIKTLGNTLLNSVNTFTVDVASPVLTMNWTVYASFTHTLVIKDGNTTVLTITGLTCSTGTNNKTVTLTSAQRTTILNYMASKKSFTGTFYLTTYSGSTQIGSTVSKTATIQTTSGTSAPTFSNFTHKDSDDNGTVDITGSNQIYIKGYSTLEITIGTVAAKNGASISSYKVTVGSTSKTFTTTTTIDYGAIDVSGTVTLKVEVIDSRGYSTPISKNITVIDYSNTAIDHYTIRRKNEVEATVQLSFSGKISPITVSNVAKNQIVSAKFRYAQNGGSYSGWCNLSINSTTNSFDFTTLELSNSSGVIEFNPNYAYSIQIRVADRLYTDTITLVLNKGTPLVALRSKKVGINTPDPQDALDVREGSILMNGYRVMGFVAALSNTEDFNDFKENGIWTQNANANASTSRNYPAAIAGYLEVMTNPSGYVLQRYTAFNCSAIYIRYFYDNKWNSWKTITIS